MAVASQYRIVKKGKHCLQVANEVLTQIKTDNSEGVLAKLRSLEQDADTFKNDADYLIKRLEAVDKFYQEQNSDVSHQIGKLRINENELSSQQKEIKDRLVGLISVLRDKESQLSSAKSNLQAAERKLRDAEKEEKNIQVGATVGGALLGLFTGGAGFLVGAAAGASIGAIVNACRDEVKDARSAVNCHGADVESARSAVGQSESIISSLECEKNSLSSQISSLELQHKKLHKNRGEIKNAISKSIEFWKMFKLSTNTGKELTNRLEQIVTQATEKGDYQILQFRENQSTFFEAWEEIESMASDGATNHMLYIDYTCAQCSIRCNSLPHLSGSNFICSSCAYQNSGKSKYIKLPHISSESVL